MNVELRLGPDDLGRCRFAISPLYETVAAVKTLVTSGRGVMHLPWMRAVAREARALDLAPLAALIPRVGYMPDFLTPPPEGPLDDVASAVTRMRSTPPDQVEREIRLSFEGTGAREVPPIVRAMLADPAAARDLLAGLLGACWERLVAPFWPALLDLLEGDLQYRARRMTQTGLAGLFEDLHPDVTWRAGRVRIRKAWSDVRDLRGEGLLLMPSAFTWPDVMVVTDQPWQPTVIYPARGIADLWLPPEHAPSEALGDLLGRTRAELLLALAEPATTSGLARRQRLSASVVSSHLGALRRAGLARSHRSGREVWYEATPLGQALVTAAARTL